MTTVFLVDDQALFRVGLKQVLEELEDVEVVGEASDLTSALPHLEADPPEVAVLAISQVDDTASIQEAQRRLPTVSLVVSSESPSDEEAVAVMEAGAVGYLSRIAGPGMAYKLLHQEEVKAEYANLTLVNSYGTLGERADSFLGMESVEIQAHPGGTAKRILTMGEAQYITDASADPRGNSALVQVGIRSYLGIPVKAEEKANAILFVHSTRAAAFQQEREFLEAVCVTVGILLRGAASSAKPVGKADA